MENMENLKAKKVLVTGGAGFIGSHLVDRLIKEGNEVFVIDDFSSGRMENLNPKAKLYKADVRSKEVFNIFKEVRPHVVFHLAARPIVDDAYQNPFEVIEVNVMGTVRLLEACRLQGDVESIVVVSSDKAYGKSDELPYKEDKTPLLGDHPYEASKSSADLIAQSYAATYNLPLAISRFSNTFGPRDIYFNRIIPGIFEAIINNKELLIRSDGTMVREYTHVDDIVDGCARLALNMEKVKGEAFNFGSKNIFSVLDLVKKIEEILGVRVGYRILNIAKNEIPEQYLDWTKAIEKLGWEPKTKFEEGIKKTFEWYKNVHFKN